VRSESSIKTGPESLTSRKPDESQVSADLVAGSRAAWLATWLLIGVHLALRLAMIGDYPVSIDSGYHVSLARWYAEHGAAFWDHINFGPGGRPNLQGPALHIAIALLGRLLGGTGDAYVLANAVLAVAQWLAAVATAVFFGRRLAGDWGALFAAALLTGSGFAVYSFAIGIPSGWTFVLAPWAVHFFLKERLIEASLITSLAIYFHLAAYATVPTGVLLAAIMTRRWRHLAIVGAATFVLTLPYTIHFARHVSWYRGARGQAAFALAPLIYLAAIPGVAIMIRRPRLHLFLWAWLAAPLAWMFQNHIRLLGQVTLVLAVIGAVWLARVHQRLSRRWRPVLVALVIVLSVVDWPIYESSLRAELRWTAGVRYPRFLDWNDARTIADVIRRASLGGRLISTYNPTQCVRYAVYFPMRIEKGHWVEVQPRHDPAEDLSAGVKAYVFPLAPDDSLLDDVRRRGWVFVHGGSSGSSVVTLAPSPPPVETVLPFVRDVIVRESQWLSANAANNLGAPRNVPLEAWRRTTTVQRLHAGRLQLAVVLYAYALEPGDPAAAKAMRGAGRGFGSLANFLGDEECIGFISESRHERLRRHLAAVATSAQALTELPASSAPLRRDLEKMFVDYFTAG